MRVRATPAQARVAATLVAHGAYLTRYAPEEGQVIFRRRGGQYVFLERYTDGVWRHIHEDDDLAARVAAQLTLDRV